MESCLCRVMKPGFHFVPTPKELILEYLKPKIDGMPLPCKHLIKESDVYGSHCTPSHIFRDDDPYWISSGSSSIKKTLYVFTKLSKKGSRAERTAGLGTWTNQNTKNITNEHGQVIGLKTSFTYTRKINTGKVDDQHDRWCMHEYSIDPAFLQCHNVENYVICAISKRCINGNEEDDLQLSAPVAVGNEVVPVAYDFHHHYNFQPRGIYDNGNLPEILNQTDFYDYLNKPAVLMHNNVQETEAPYNSTRQP